MKIKKLEIKNFKNHVSLKLTFNDNKTTIKGDNGTGKTSIGEAIAWCLTGCDLYGKENVANRLIKNGEKNMQVRLVIEKDGREYEIVRTKNGNNTDITINGLKSTQLDLCTNFVMDKQVFFSIFNPLYFTSLSPKDDKTMLLKVLPDITNEKVFQELPKEVSERLKKEDFISANSLIERTRAELKEWEDSKLYCQGVIDGQKTDIKIPDELFFDNTKLEELEKELLSIQAQPQDVRKIELEKKLAELKVKENALPFEKPQLNDTKVFEKRRQELLNEYNSVKKELVDIKPKTIKCNKCGNEMDINETERQRLMKQLADVKEKGIKITAELKQAQAENEKLTAEYNESIKIYKETVANEIKKTEYQLAVIEHELKEAETERKQKADELQKRIAALREEQQRVLINNQNRINLLKQQQEAKQKIKEAEEDLKHAEIKIAELKILIDYAKMFNAKKLELESQVISQYLNKVSLQLQKIVKDTGEIKDDFKILYDGREFNVLSHSERIKAGLEVANLIMGLTGLSFPIFIDDAESITVYETPSTQVIEARVEANTELEVKLEKEEAVC